nr:MAG TPA: hypothetical protein [Caudoviricetes sp.]
MPISILLIVRLVATAKNQLTTYISAKSLFTLSYISFYTTKDNLPDYIFLY